MHAHLRRAGQHLKDHVIPHDRNGHRPYALRHHVLVGYSAILILLKALALMAAIALPSATVFSSSITTDNVLTLTNAARTQAGIGVLRENTLLDRAATEKAQGMVAHQYFAHTSPSGVTPWSWVHGVGYRYLYSGENLAVHFSSAEDTQDAWMLSPTHRANILNTRFTESGVGVATGIFEGAPSIFVVQYFGTPLPAESTSTPAEEIVPTSTKPVIEGIAQLRKTPTSLTVTVRAEHASSVQIGFAGSMTPLTATGTSSTWTGTLPLPQGIGVGQAEPMTAVAGSTYGGLVSQPLAEFSADPVPAHQFAFNIADAHRYRLFGLIPVDGLQDSVRRFYLYFIIGLGAILLLDMFVRRRLSQYSVIAHTACVMGLAILLAVL